MTLHVPRGGGHILTAGAHRYQNPHLTHSPLNGRAKKVQGLGQDQGRPLEVPKGRRAWSLTEMALQTRARGRGVRVIIRLMSFYMIILIECSSAFLYELAVLFLTEYLERLS